MYVDRSGVEKGQKDSVVMFFSQAGAQAQH